MAGIFAPLQRSFTNSFVSERQLIKKKTSFNDDSNGAYHTVQNVKKCSILPTFGDRVSFFFFHVDEWFWIWVELHFGIDADPLILIWFARPGDWW